MSVTFTVRKPEDMIALTPVVLGFQPVNSLVMLTFESFTARIDIPAVDEIDECVDSLLDPAMRHEVKQVAFLIFDEDGHDELEVALLSSFRQANVPIVAAMAVTSGQYRMFGSYEWVDYDITGHPILLDAHYADVAPKHGTRRDLEAYVKPCGEAWTDEVTAAVQGLQSNGLEAIILSLTKQSREQQVELWTAALRGSTPELVEDIAVVLGFAAWLKGDGAMAWVALDQADNSTKWGVMLHLMLRSSISPATWPW